MVNVSQQALDRLAEMAVFGHYNEITGDSPRINDYLNQLRTWNKTLEEEAFTAVFVSNTVLKRYDALTLPDYLGDRNPFLRIFTKFMAWPVQHHSYLYRQLRTAAAEVRTNQNWQPTWNLLATSFFTAAIGGSTAMLFAALQGA